ncbi:hypothetical protein V9T40_001204 [Parthenolecanium corni]|uniref:Peroxidase n=1 Tax=Parthenolecanium corni TaxID=536013 RepID=A0AAN9TB71_9HEMI
MPFRFDTQAKWMDEFSEYLDPKVQNKLNPNILNDWNKRGTANFFGCAIAVRNGVSGMTGVGIRVHHERVIYLLCVYATWSEWYTLVGPYFDGSQNCNFQSTEIRGLDKIQFVKDTKHQSAICRRATLLDGINSQTFIEDIPCAVYSKNLEKSTFYRRPCRGVPTRTWSDSSLPNFRPVVPFSSKTLIDDTVIFELQAPPSSAPLNVMYDSKEYVMSRYLFKTKTQEQENLYGNTDREDNTDALLVVLPYQSLITLINEAVDEGKQQLRVRQLKDENVAPLDPDSPTYKHQQSIVYSQQGSNLSNYGYIEAEATKYLRDKGVHNVINYDSATDLKWADETDCRHFNQPVQCEATPYRSIDGSCNNLKYPKKWGVAMTPFRRALPPTYEDGVSVPRGGFESTSLPSARDVSTKIHRPVYQKDEDFTVMLAVWGQFLDHDITATALSRGVNGTPITCCDSKIQHPECFPVRIKSDDPYYSKFNLKCMEFVRSAPALRCSFGPREQMNQASSYIDGSMVYGNTESLANRLRTFNNGELEMLHTGDGRALLPVSKDTADGCNQDEEIKKGRYCFISGDTRANENTNLVSIHLILARQHNNISNQLRAFNPFWDDETLYQETRRIVAAQLQHITYNEFLPSILGEQLTEKLELYSQKSGYWTKYKDNVDATINNNFATATFRFAHTLIPRMMKMLANDTESPEYIEMHKMLFNPFGLYDGDLDSIIRGAFNTSVEKADNFFTEQLTKHLFESNSKKKSSTKSFGLDLVSLNIQRGRDHGLQTYVEFRKYCNLSSVQTYDDLKGIFDDESLESVSSLYKTVRDIDLYTGGLSEIPIAGGLLGPTLTCLIADQFYRLKYGDRFWYETYEKPQAFTPEQLDEIRKTSLAGIICQNADDLQMVTPLVMRSTKNNNEHVPCSKIPQPKISVWQENAEKKFGLNVIHIRIEYPERVYTWNNQSDTPLSPEILSNGQLTSVVAWTIRSNQNNVVELKGTFAFATKSGKELNGLFELTAETSTYLNVNNMRIKFPIRISDNSSDSDISNSSRIILHTVPVSGGKLVWTGTVSVNLIPLFWSNDTDHRSNKTDETHNSEQDPQKPNESPSSKTTLRQGQEEYAESRELDVDESKFSVPHKRAQDLNSTLTKDGENNSQRKPTESPTSSITHRQGQEEYAESRELDVDQSKFSVPLKRSQDSNSTPTKGEKNDFQNAEQESSKKAVQTGEPTKHTAESKLKKDYDFFKKNGTESEEDLVEDDEEEISTTIPDFVSTNDSSHEDNILYHILENHTPRDTTLEEDEREFLHDLSSDSSAFLNASPKPPSVQEQIITASISVQQLVLPDVAVLNPPADIPTGSIENQTVVWNIDSVHPLSGFFELSHKNGTFRIKYDSDTNVDFILNQGCNYYSKIFLHEPAANESNIFDLDLDGVGNPEGCTVIAPLQLHGSKGTSSTFTWNGNVSLRVRKPRKDLRQEEELSLKLKPKQIYNVEGVDGTISSKEEILWNGSLPVFFPVNNLGWSSTKHAIALPVTWSGNYEESSFIGNFVVLQKAKNSVERREGKFSLKVPESLQEMIKSFDMHQSVVYFTDEILYTQEINIFQFDEIDEWDSNSASKIILIGNFVKDGFVWSGKVIYIVPKNAETTSESNVMLRYRPHGIYQAKIFDATLFAVLDKSSKVLKWWSGVLPPTVIIPSSQPQLETYKSLFNKAIVWSYEEHNAFGHATFKTYGNESNIHLFGDFEFQATSLFENIQTSSLKPNVTYYSPLVLQGEKKYSTETDLINKLEDWRRPNAGIFAPVMLLGNFTEDGTFIWTMQCIVYVEDDY